MTARATRAGSWLSGGAPVPIFRAVITHRIHAGAGAAGLFPPLAGGGGDRPNDSRAARPADHPLPVVVAPAEQQHAAPDQRPRVVILGDSLTAGLGLHQRDSYPTLLQQKVDAAGLGYQVVNAGVSGDTSAGGLSRLDWA